MDPLFVWIETTALSTWIREAQTVLAFPTILALHTLGMGFVAGGSATIALRTLGLAPGIPVRELSRVLPVIWIAFVVNFISGVLLLMAYPAKALTNPLFYVKLGAVVAAVCVVRHLDRDVLRPGDSALAVSSRGRGLAVASLLLWAAVIASGRLLAYTHSKLLVSSAVDLWLGGNA